jgi:hypothetical protein
MMKRYPLIALGLAVLSALALASCGGVTEPADAGDRAAIVDQLYLLEPDPEFIAEAKEILESGGFTVDVWQGEEITVDFYRDLPRRGYEFIIFRVHSGLVLEVTDGEAVPLEETYLFTAETYTTTKYITDQLNDKVSRVLFSDEYPEVFAVNSEFIRQNSRGDYDNTFIIAMGCESYHFDDLPRAFMEKGASAYIGWSTIVSLEYVDGVTLALLDNLCSGNMTLAQGVEQTMAELGHDPYFDTYLKYCPAESGDRKVAELID